MIQVIDSQICLGGEKLKDSCYGDSGGPLMHKVNGFWELVGVISAGFMCGSENMPGVYNRVSEYKEWIEENLKA